MSGGIDSTVSAMLLLEQGYEVVGCTFRTFDSIKESCLAREKGCCSIESIMEAKHNAEQMGFEHHIVDFRETFRQCVIQNFIDEYMSGRTPNPCVLCNSHIKWGELMRVADELGCDFIATGHYANIEFSEKYNQYVLTKSKAGKKDQSYVLWNIPKELLEHVVFPLSNFESKEEIRKIASENNIKVAQKPDSEDICFVPDGNYKKFLENNSDIKPKEGDIVDSKGTVLGKHTGLYNYTIGQRKGMGISHPTPLFVIGFNALKNQVIVGEYDELFKKEILVKDINILLFDKIIEPMKVKVKTRYSQTEADAIMEQLSDNEIKVKFDEPQRAPTPGQSAVFYLNDIVVGGGKIV